MRELLDRQQNWIFLTPDTFNKGPAPADMFNKEDEPTGPSTGNSKVIENFWKEQDRQNGLGSPLSTRSRAVSEEKDTPALAPLSARDSEKGSLPNWNGLFNQKGTASDPLQSSDGIFGGLFNLNRPVEASPLSNGTLGLPGMTDSAKDPVDDFTKLLRGRSSSTLDRGYGSIRSLGDSPSDEMNPGSAKTLDDYSRAKLLGVTDRLPGSLANFGPNQSGLFQDPNAKILGEPALKPAYSAPPPTKYVQPQPTVLELPKRKF
jgi:hypothetical protein